MGLVRAGLAPAVLTSTTADKFVSSGSAWPQANRAVFTRVEAPGGRVYRYFLVESYAAATHNVQVGVVRLSTLTSSGADFTKVMDSGLFTPADGIKRIDLGATYLIAGDYALFMWADNVAVQAQTASCNFAQSIHLGGSYDNAAGVGASGTLSWYAQSLAAGLETA